MTSTVSVDLDDVQAIILRGYRYGEDLPHLRFLFVSLGDDGSAKAFVRSLQGSITSCASWDGDPSHRAPVINLTLTPSGLRKLGDDTKGFPADFVNGVMTRSILLGDVGRSAPEHWEAGYRADDLDAVVVLQAASLAQVQTARQTVQDALASAPAARLVFEEEANHFPSDVSQASEHFGFKDGIGQPDVEGSGLVGYPGEGTPEHDPRWVPLATGSFLLGYVDEFGNNHYDDPRFRNGSYIVLRKLEQRVVEFREFTARMAGPDGDATFEAARLVGRWQSGAPLDLVPESDDPALGSDPWRNNDFRYDQDAAGLRCPHGAHMRRANPRADPTGPTLQQIREHRIIRHGIPYGPWLPDNAPDDGQSRGIFFLVTNASIVDQFEYVQQNWMEGTLSSTALSTEIDKDPLVGSNDGQHSKFVANGVAGPTVGWGLPRFVEVRGSIYLFVPSVSRLAALAAS